MVPWALVAAVVAAIEAETGEAVRVRAIRPVGPAPGGGGLGPAGGHAEGVAPAGGPVSAGRVAPAGWAVAGPAGGGPPSPWALAGRQELLAARAAMSTRPWAAAWGGRARARGSDGDDGRTRG
ncbi:MAG TPA: hypothetical protein VIL40_02345 [Thermaerobacter sp.]